MHRWRLESCSFYFNCCKLSCKALTKFSCTLPYLGSHKLKGASCSGCVLRACYTHWAVTHPPTRPLSHMSALVRMYSHARPHAPAHPPTQVSPETHQTNDSKATPAALHQDRNTFIVTAHNHTCGGGMYMQCAADYHSYGTKGTQTMHSLMSAQQKGPVARMGWTVSFVESHSWIELPYGSAWFTPSASHDNNK